MSRQDMGTGRPADFDADFLAACDREMAHYRAAVRRGEAVPYAGRIPDGWFDDPEIRENWYAGAWLHRELIKAGLTDAESRLYCRLHGRSSLPGSADYDPWGVAKEMLAAYKNRGEG